MVSIRQVVIAVVVRSVCDPVVRDRIPGACRGVLVDAVAHSRHSDLSAIIGSMLDAVDADAAPVIKTSATKPTAADANAIGSTGPIP